MRSKFDDAENPTYGTLVRRNVGDDAPNWLVAVIVRSPSTALTERRTSSGYCPTPSVT
jgi:hypothetical protein